MLDNYKSYYLPVPPQERTAIIDAVYRFGAGQDLRDRALLASAFSEGASLDFTAVAGRLGVEIPVFEGRDAIVETVFSATSQLDTTHTVSNARVTAYDGKTASLFALIEAEHLPSGDHSRHLLLKNILAVDLSKDGDAWVIDRMIFTNAWRQGDVGVLFPTV